MTTLNYPTKNNATERSNVRIVEGGQPSITICKTSGSVISDSNLLILYSDFTSTLWRCSKLNTPPPFKHSGCSRRPEYTSAGVYPGRPIYYGLGQFIPRDIFCPRPIHTPSGHNIPR